VKEQIVAELERTGTEETSSKFSTMTEIITGEGICCPGLSCHNLSPLVFQENTDWYVFTALGTISAPGLVLTPRLITKKETEHPDAEQSSFLPNSRRYISANAFVTRPIFLLLMTASIICQTVSMQDFCPLTRHSSSSSAALGSMLS
jgi:hypothetical protein